MKRLLILSALFFVAVMVSMLVAFPNMLNIIEYNSYFSGDSAFFVKKMGDVPGLTSWLYCLLSQLFRWAWVGALIETLVLISVALLCGLSLKRLGALHPELALMVPLFLLAFYPLQLNLYLHTMFFFLAFVAYVSIKNCWGRWLLALAVMVAGYVLMPWTMLFVLLVLMAVTEWKFFKSGRRCLFLLLPLAALIAIVPIYSSCVSFTPFEKRYFVASVGMLPVCFFLTAILLPIVLAFLPERWFKFARKVKYAVLGLMVLMVCWGIFRFVNDSRSNMLEESYRFADLAEKGEWQTLLDEVPMNSLMFNKYNMVYVLLAESEMGQLPENLMKYPIVNPAQFTCRGDSKHRAGCTVNRLFYKGLGLYDEAIHQAFEYGTLCDEGYCFGSLRQIAEYAVNEGNLPLADKYLNILARSSFHGAFVKEWREKMAQSKVKPVENLRCENFAGAYKFNSEMVRHMQFFPNNKKILDYLLCGLLLNREIAKFQIVLDQCKLYEGKKLPKVYAEAIAMMNVSAGNLHEMYDYDTEFDDNQDRFRTALQKGDYMLINSFQNTYWHYCFATTSSDAETGATQLVN